MWSFKIRVHFNFKFLFPRDFYCPFTFMKYFPSKISFKIHFLLVSTSLFHSKICHLFSSDSFYSLCKCMFTFHPKEIYMRMFMLNKRDRRRHNSINSINTDFKLLPNLVCRIMNIIDGNVSDFTGYTRSIIPNNFPLSTVNSHMHRPFAGFVVLGTTL